MGYTPMMAWTKADDSGLIVWSKPRTDEQPGAGLKWPYPSILDDRRAGVRRPFAIPMPAS